MARTTKFKLHYHEDPRTDVRRIQNVDPGAASIEAGEDDVLGVKTAAWDWLSYKGSGYITAVDTRTNQRMLTVGYVLHDDE